VLLRVQLEGIERAVDLAEFEELVRSGTVGPETPVSVPKGSVLLSGALGGTGADRWMAAHVLPVFRELRDSPASVLRRRWARPPVPWATALVVGGLLRVHLWVRGDARIVAEEWLVKDGAAIHERGEWWRLFGYGLLHADAGHLLMNGLFLAWTGVALETALGPAAVFTLFVASVLGGGLLSTLFGQGATIGASGADFGFLAAAVVYGFRYEELIPRRQRPLFGGAMLAYLCWGLFNGLTSPQVDNLAHIGGALAGFAVALGLRPARGGTAEGRAQAFRNARAHAAVVVASAAAVVGLLMRPLPTVPVLEDGLTTVRPADWNVGWAAAGDRGWTSTLGDATVVARTDHHDAGRPDARQALDTLLARYQAADASAAFDAPRAETRDGVRGWRTEGNWTRDGQSRRVAFALYARGAYLHTLVVDLPADDTRRAGLVEQVIDGSRLGPLADAPPSDPEASTPRQMVQRARASAEVGQDAEALRLVRVARSQAPADTVPVVAELELLAIIEPDSVPAAARDALAAHPADTTVTAAAVRSLVDAGRPDQARVVLDAARAAAPTDRRLARAARDLDDVAAPAGLPDQQPPLAPGP
jgi:membrane associated rhomboid family serine protease